MLSIFNKPYPFNEDLKHNVKNIFFISAGVFVFLFLFQPFEISSLPTRGKYYLLGGLCFSTFLSLSLNLLLIPSFFPRLFRSATWNIKKEIAWDTWMLFTTLAGYFFVNNSLGIEKFVFYTVIKLVLIAVIPITLLIIINHNKILRSNLKLADDMSKKLWENKRVQEKIITFNSNYQKDSLSIKISSLLLVKSANNYIEVFWKEGKSIKNQMVRCSMTYTEELVKEYKFIFKCHRSYIININYIDKIEGNSQGYKLFFEDFSIPVPVSRNSISKLQELI